MYSSSCVNYASLKKTLGEPGKFPYTRGIYPEMYRKRLWTMRQYTGFGSAAETNRRFKFLISQGQTGLSVAFDLPTQLGMDSDHSRAVGEVGRVGVAVSSLRDMELLFDGIDLGSVSTSMTINATAAILFSMYSVLAESNGKRDVRPRGTTQNDILKEFIARNTYIYPPEPSVRLAVDLIEYCARNAREWHPISISGYHMREAGANAVQELAYAFSDAITYVEACLKRGLNIDSFAPNLSFFFACGNDFFEEIAKFRAARRIWARLMKTKFKAKLANSLKLRFHTQTSGETLTAQEPENNVVRVALQALAAVLGGTQSLHTNSRDEALSLPTEESVKIALRTQQIIAYESMVTRTVDPLGGSFYLEELTRGLEAAACEEIENVEERGGALAAIQGGYIQGQIRENAYAVQREIEEKRRIVVGVNMFLEEDKPSIRIHAIDKKIERAQIERLRSLKASRSGSAVSAVLSEIHHAATSGKNVVPSIRKAVKHLATTGEIADALRSAFGEYRQTAPL